METEEIQRIFENIVKHEINEDYDDYETPFDQGGDEDDVEDAGLSHRSSVRDQVAIRREITDMIGKLEPYDVESTMVFPLIDCLLMQSDGDYDKVIETISKKIKWSEGRQEEYFKKILTLVEKMKESQGRANDYVKKMMDKK